jgi:hypothetical protein
MVAVGIAFSAAAAGTAVYAGIPDAANIYYGCVLNGVGTVRLIDPSLSSSSLLSHCISGKETPITWNQQGPQGPAGLPGANGRDGANGKDGTSITSSSLATGDSNCPNGGVQFQSASGYAYACNGKDGANGKDGTDGMPGTMVTSITQLNGIQCTMANGDPGIAAVNTQADNTITTTCITAVPCNSADLPGAIKINEIAQSTSNGFYVELYNTCSGVVDLSGWKLIYRNPDDNGNPDSRDTTAFVIPSGTKLRPGAFLAVGSCGSCTLVGAGIGTQNGGGAVGVRMSDDRLVDSVCWGTCSIYTQSRVLGEGTPLVISGWPTSFGRLPDGADTDDNSVDFKPMGLFTPGSANIAPTAH